MYKPIMLTPSPEERRALLEMSKQDLREPWDQMRYLIVAEATRRGLLPDTNRDAGYDLAATGVSR
jgi:hypothetical protein